LVTGRIAGESAAEAVGASAVQVDVDSALERAMQEEWAKLQQFWHPSEVERDAESMLKIRKELQKILWQGAGPLRTEEQLQAALGQVRSLRERLLAIPLAKQDTFALSLVEKLETYHMSLVGEAVILGAIERRETRGAHVRLDHPEQSDHVYSSKFRLDDDEQWSMDKVKLG